MGAGQPDAVDWLERHNYDRCLVDSAYMAEHKEWFRNAARERGRRSQEAARLEREKAVNAARIAQFEQRLEEARASAETARGRSGAKLDDATAGFSGTREGGSEMVKAHDDAFLESVATVLAQALRPASSRRSSAPTASGIRSRSPPRGSSKRAPRIGRPSEIPRGG
jgi:hypothetical protein